MHLSYSFIFLLLIFFMLEAPITQAQGKSTLVSAIFAFGDSTADPGNNNYIKTPARSNFSPYGRDFPNHVATGRFTNGMLIYDFIAKHVGVKQSVPPYLDQSLSTEELKTGASFASAGTGFDPLTPKISEIMDQGARKIAVANLLPMGCLPFVITLNSDIINAITKRDCIDSQSSIAQDYNFKLQNKLNDMQIRFAKLGSRIAYMDIYTPLVDMILGRKYDFENVNRGCCGTGSVEFAFLCNPISFVCPNASKYVFWDSIHPTEKAYYLVSQALQPTIDSITKY
ncbi:GDSL esterase/lipase At5g45960-like isoform X2 [Lycium ferocissimum]|uniref:GDSL esterase/lipase At5g45960-like isoform X2 n=1 Tax=Lycium ferocissimum TaxID=112874 RepID=UPI0028164F43|nr:GDSL esterase/lipase At5g45960-like isoform X2 [Lycium ferocissimum]